MSSGPCSKCFQCSPAAGTSTPLYSSVTAWILTSSTSSTASTTSWPNHSSSSHRGRDGRAWYRLLEPVRQYAEDALAASGRSTLVRSADLEHYLHWARQWTAHLPGPGPGWKHQLLDRFANLRTAVSWGLESRDGERTTELIRRLDWARFLFQINEIGDWAEQALDLPDIEQLDDGPAMAQNAAFARWQQADMAGVHRLSDLFMGLPNRQPARHADSFAEAFFRALAGDFDQIRPTLDRIDIFDPLVELSVAHGKFAFSGGVPLEDDELNRLEELLAASRSPLVATLLHQINATVALGRGNFEDAAAQCRKAYVAAADIGASYFMHTSTPLLASVAGATGQLSTDDARTITTTLRQQLDAGQQNELWVVVKCLDVWLYCVGHHALAIAIHNGYASTVYASTWRDHPNHRDDVAAYQQLRHAAEKTATEPVRSIFELVDDTLTIVDDIAHDHHAGA